MEQYTVTGMSCAACVTRVEKAVGNVPGVTSCSVSLLTNSMGIEGTASPSEIIRAVEEAGYGASKKGEEQGPGDTDSQTAADRISGIFAGADVLFHGTYDVGLAAAEVF